MASKGLAVGKPKQPVGSPAVTNSPLANQYSQYSGAVAQNAGDYSEIMDRYRELASNPNGIGTSGQFDQSKMQFKPQTIARPEQYSYAQTPGSADALSKMKELTETGGYSGDDIANLRERAISPIRSVYAGANRDMARNRSIQGGMGVNYNAARSKNAREMSETMSGAMTNVNAGIAQNVAQNKLSMAPQYASATGSESALRNQYGRANVDSVNATNAQNANTVNDANKFNTEIASRFNTQDNDNKLRAIEGMRGLYGTTPAMSSLFGSQALSHAGMESQNKNASNQNVMDMIRQLMSRRN